jgi:predicted nicotinamide N-methyase
MSSFSFNFFEPVSAAETPAAASLPPAAAVTTDPAASAAVAVIDARSLVLEPASSYACADFAGGLKRRMVEHDEVSGCSGRDVVDGVYEGGAKIWECSADLIEWLGSAGVPPGCTVLDLGCGAAMLGCWAASIGRAAHVICQDLNAPVLNELAAVNLLLNGGLGPAPGPAATLVAASWHGMAAELEAAAGALEAAPGGASAARTGASPLAATVAGACDYVLASEVLYREEHYPDLLRILTRCLKPGTGVAIIGSKRNYFGATLGGSSLAFVQFVNARAVGTGSGDSAAGGSGAASTSCKAGSEGIASRAGAAAASTAGAPSLACTVNAGERAVLRAEIVRSIEDGKSMTRDIITLRWARVAAAPA